MFPSENCQNSYWLRFSCSSSLGYFWAGRRAENAPTGVVSSERISRVASRSSLTTSTPACRNRTVVNNQRRPGGMESRTSGHIDFGDSERMRGEGWQAALPTQNAGVLNSQRRRWRPIGMSPRPLSGTSTGFLVLGLLPSKYLIRFYSVPLSRAVVTNCLTEWGLCYRRPTQNPRDEDLVQDPGRVSFATCAASQNKREETFRGLADPTLQKGLSKGDH